MRCHCYQETVDTSRDERIRRILKGDALPLLRRLWIFVFFRKPRRAFSSGWVTDVSDRIHIHHVLRAYAVTIFYDTTAPTRHHALGPVAVDEAASRAMVGRIDRTDDGNTRDAAKHARDLFNHLAGRGMMTLASSRLRKARFVFLHLLVAGILDDRMRVASA